LLALFFSALMLLQGCTVYKSAFVAHDEASKSLTKVRVEKKNGEKVKYSRIVVLDNHKFFKEK
jgi:hypothetical protein